MILDSDVTPTGGGTITLSATPGLLTSQITSDGFQLTNVDNVIQSQGNLGTNLTAIINQPGGLVNGNVNGQVLIVDPINSPTGFVNHGLLEATGGGLRQLSGGGGGGFINTGANMLANGAGSEVQFINSARVTGGTLSAINGGILHNLTGQTAAWRSTRTHSLGGQPGF